MVSGFVSKTQAAGAMVSITFDDGFASTYEHALPVLNANGLTATAFITTGNIGENRFMTWNQVVDLQNGHGWEIGGHSVNHPNLAPGDSTEVTSVEIATEVNDSLDTLLGFGLDVVSFAPPFGAYDNAVLTEVLKRYESNRGFHDRDELNSFPYQRDVLMVKSVQTGVSPAQVKAWVDLALNEKKWLILVYHEVLPELDPDYEYSNTIAELAEVAAYIRSVGIEAVTPNHALRSSGTNILSNGSFDQGLSQGWQFVNGDAAGVRIDTANHGSYPSSRNSLLLNSTGSPTHLRSKRISVSGSASEYLFNVFVNTDNLSVGEVGFYIDEYSAGGEWISGQWKGDVTPGEVTWFSFSYQPTSAAVSSFAWQTYTDEENDGPVYLDNYSLYKF